MPVLGAEAMRTRSSARDLELRAAHSGQLGKRAFSVPDGEVTAMLARRGLKPERTIRCPILPQPLSDSMEDSFSQWLGHYAFRLFLRGAIQRSEGFRPAETTRYLEKTQSRDEKISRNRYRLKLPTCNFGRTLEWYVGRELERRFGFDVATGVRLHIRGGGGDLDVVAAAEGKLVYIELKSSPPKNLAASEMGAFWERVNLLRPDVSLFVVDTALRLSDKVVPMLLEELRRRACSPAKPATIAAQVWALTPHVYAANGSRDLIANIMKAIAAGFRALSPPFPAADIRS
jgi:hypothetical protein